MSYQNLRTLKKKKTNEYSFIQTSLKRVLVIKPIKKIPHYIFDYETERMTTNLKR